MAKRKMFFGNYNLLAKDWPADVQLAYDMGGDVYIHVINRVAEVDAIIAGGTDYIQQTIDKAHSLGMDIHLSLGPEYYATPPGKDAFFTQPAAKTKFLAHLDWLLSKNIDGLMLHEPTSNGVRSNCLALQQFNDAFFLECDRKVKTAKGAAFPWGFATGSNNTGVCTTASQTGMSGMGIDIPYMQRNNLFSTQYISVPSSLLSDSIPGMIDEWVGSTGRLPGRAYTLTLYTSIGGTNTGKNPNFLAQFNYCNQKGYPVIVFMTSQAAYYRAEIMAAWKTGATAPDATFTATDPLTGAIKETAQPGEYIRFTDTSTNNPTSHTYNFGDGSPVTSLNPVSHRFANPGTYTVAHTATNANGSSTKTKIITIQSQAGGLMFEDHFNTSQLIGWEIVATQNKISTANSVLDMRADAPSDRVWIRKKNPDGTRFTWKYGKLQVRMKVPSATNTRTGFWCYHNNQVPCASNSAILAQDSINFEICKSRSSYTDTHGTRVAGHLTSAWSTWTTAKCNQYYFYDTPDEYLAYHDYEFEWTPTAVVFRRDGVEIRRVTDPTMIPTNPIDLNIAMEFGDITGITWMDTNPPVYPVIFQVDSVRLYALEEVGAGNLDLRSVPTGARAFIDGIEKGNTNIIIPGLAGGTRVIKLQKEGFVDAEGQADIVSGQTTVKEFTLVPVKVNSPVTIYLNYIVTAVYGQYTIDVSAIRYSGGRWLDSNNPDAEMREYALNKVPDIIGRSMISTDILYINGILQKQNQPTEGDSRTVNCPKNGQPIKQIFRDGQWRTLDTDIHVCEETDYISLALKATIGYAVLSSLLG